MSLVPDVDTPVTRAVCSRQQGGSLACWGVGKDHAEDLVTDVTVRLAADRGDRQVHVSCAHCGAHYLSLEVLHQTSLRRKQSLCCRRHTRSELRECQIKFHWP